MSCDQSADMESLLGDFNKQCEESQPEIDRLIRENSMAMDALLDQLRKNGNTPLAGTPVKKNYPPNCPIKTPVDAARWMVSELAKSGTLYQSDIVHCLGRHFGEWATRINSDGNRVISGEVLKAFRKLTSKDVVWSRSDLLWRYRRAGDPLGRRRVE